VIGDESEGGDCDEVICAGWGEPDESEQNEVDGMKKGADSTDEVMHMWKSGWFVMRRIRVVELGWRDNRWGAGSTCRLNRDKFVYSGCKNFVGEWQEFIFNAFICAPTALALPVATPFKVVFQCYNLVPDPLQALSPPRCCGLYWHATAEHNWNKLTTKSNCWNCVCRPIFDSPAALTTFMQ